MKIVFISNALDHIQMPLCDEFYLQTNGNFNYIATTQASAIRSDITSSDINKTKPYVIRPYEGEEQEKEARKVICEADAAILGTAPEVYIRDRIKKNKLTFRYAERLYKTPFTINNFSRRIASVFLHHTRYQKKELYLLCAGAYAACDHELFRNYRNKRYVWGYFPVFTEHDINELLANKKDNCTVEIIWVGRFVGLKHPEQVIQLAQYLKNREISFHINMIGYGEMINGCEEIVRKMGLSEVDILGPKTPSEVRVYMDKADILLFTSDREEGWGAVVNEGMNSACAVVASAAAGVSPYLVRDEENGFLYDCRNQNSLNRKVEKLITDEELRMKLAKNGYQTVHDFWNPRNAVTSFITLTESILNQKQNPVKEGPCSPAPVIKDGWYRDE